jgi:hypothetical protein
MSFLAAFSLFMAAGLILVIVTFSRRMDRQMEEDLYISDVPWSFGRIPMSDEEIEQLERDLASRGLFPHYRNQREA